NTLHSVYALTANSESVVERYRYDAYGAATVLDADGSDDSDGLSDVDNPYMFTGRRMDPESGLMYLRSRYYDPGLGRFLSWDPIPQANLYVYVSGGPATSTDPYGRAETKNCRGVGMDSFSITGKVKLFGIKLDYDIHGSVDLQECKVCCSDGRKVTDEMVALSVHGSLSFGGGTFPTGFEWGPFECTAWFGIHGEIPGGGSVSDEIGSDRCSGKEKEGRLCLTVVAGGEVAVGGEIVLRWRRKTFAVGAKGTFSGTGSLKRCYKCSNGACSWGRTELCATADPTVHFRLFWKHVRINIWEGSKCWSL
ncbi:MAG: hypothetical protein GTN93_07565, partial [Anaerolineae bacterium]|nr:hypothetical protein [Anaerolineae bacterium]